MQYTLIDENRRQDAIKHIESLDISTEYEVFIRPYKRNRSRSQNNLIWMWYPYIAENTGYTEEELHEILKRIVIGYDVFMYDCRYYIKPKTSTRLTVKGMTKFINAIEWLADWLEIKLPYPDDYNVAIGNK